MLNYFFCRCISLFDVKYKFFKNLLTTAVNIKLLILLLLFNFSLIYTRKVVHKNKRISKSTNKNLNFVNLIVFCFRCLILNRVVKYPAVKNSLYIYYNIYNNILTS